MPNLLRIQSAAVVYVISLEDGIDGKLELIFGGFLGHSNKENDIIPEG